MQPFYLCDPIVVANRGCFGYVPDTSRQVQAWLDCQCECPRQGRLWFEGNPPTDASRHRYLGLWLGLVTDVDEEVSIF